MRSELERRAASPTTFQTGQVAATLASDEDDVRGSETAAGPTRAQIVGTLAVHGCLAGEGRRIARSGRTLQAERVADREATTVVELETTALAALLSHASHRSLLRPRSVF